MAFLEKLLRSKAVIWTLIVVPGLWPVWPIFVSHNPSVLADPLRFVLHHLGFTATLLLVAVLSFSPLRVLFPKWGVALALNRHRRLVGVSACAYGVLHFITHLVYEIGGGTTWAKILRTALNLPFQRAGVITLAILLVLAVTSLPALVRWLGGKNWKYLHRFAYVAAAFAAYHQGTGRKTFPQQVLWIFVPLAVLELLRVAKQFAASRTTVTASRAEGSG